jgi:hypothetical protein
MLGGVHTSLRAYLAGCSMQQCYSCAIEELELVVGVIVILTVFD